MKGEGTQIRIQVLRVDEIPVSDARVMLASNDVDLPDIAALSDGNGKVLLGAVKNADYEITCASEGFETKRQVLTVGDRDVVDVVIELAR
jgi:hypothetical protein